MIRWLIGGLILFAGIIFAISLILSVDSLSKCGTTPSQLSGCQPADVIVAVSGGDTGARTQEAIDLYKNGWAKKVIFSGAALDKTGPSNAEVMRRQAISQGVPTEDIITEQISESTKENAHQTAGILKKLGTESAILVTSSYHQKRTLLEFKHQSPEVDFRVQPSSSDNQWSVWWWTTPLGWYLAISEVTKITVFYLGGTR